MYRGTPNIIIGHGMLLGTVRAVRAVRAPFVAVDTFVTAVGSVGSRKRGEEALIVQMDGEK